MFRMTVERFAELRPSLLPTKLPSFLSLSRRRRDFVELKMFLSGFESRRRVLDGRDIFHIDVLQKLYCLFEKTENK